MIDVRSDGLFINVSLNTEWDCNLNNHCGGNKAVVEIQPGPNLRTMQAELAELKTLMLAMQAERNAEQQLRDTNPALQDIYNQYSAILQLVKDHETEDTKI